jgi:hypothetical protein
MAGFNTEFVVASSKVLDERVAADHERCGPVRSQTSYRAKPCLESSVVALAPVVRILRGVVESVGEKFVDDAQQRCGQIRGDLQRSFATGQRRLEEPGRRFDVAPLRHVYVDDLAVLVDCPVHVAPDAGDFDVGLINEPAVADAVSAWPRSSRSTVESSDVRSPGQGLRALTNAETTWPSAVRAASSSMPAASSSSRASSKS